MNILTIHNSTGSRLYRILPMAKYAQKAGHNVKVTGLKAGKTGGIPDTDLQWADVVVVEMVYSPSFIKACKKANATVIYEIDDLMQKVSKNHPCYEDMNWRRTYLTYRCLGMADHLTVTTDVLKKTYKWFNQDITILPNYLDIEFWEKPHNPNQSDTIRLGWSGGNSHKDDLLFIKPVIEKVLMKYSNVKFVACGFGGTNSPSEWVNYNYGENIFDNLPPERYEFSLGAPMEVWPSKLNSLRFDIGLAPVVDSQFNKCKSNCKAQEYGINHLPGVYSRFLYHDAVKDGETGYLVDTEEEWYDRICELIENENKRKVMGEYAFGHIKTNFDFNNYGHKWIECYEKALNT